MEFRDGEEVILNMKECTPERENKLIEDVINKVNKLKKNQPYLLGQVIEVIDEPETYKVKWNVFRGDFGDTIEYVMHPSELLHYRPRISGLDNHIIRYRNDGASVKSGGKKARKLRKSRKAHKTRKTKKMRKSRRRMRR